jgi:hypothetical protein
MKFDVSDIPEAATIASADLKLYFYSKYGTTIKNRTIQCHQVLKDWLESQATWYNRLSGTSWGTNGVGLDNVDAKSTAEDSQNWYNEYPTWKTYDITSLTQRWVDGTDAYYGVIFWATDEDDYTDGDEKWVYSSEYSNASLRPQLEIEYTIDSFVAYSYDAFSRPATVDYGNGMVETNQYDADRGWIEGRDYEDSSSDTLFYIHNKSYDAAGNLLKQVYGHSAN